MSHVTPSTKTSSSTSKEPFLDEGHHENHIFLNIDGVVQLDSGNVVIGGVVRDGNGNWIFGYNCHRRCWIFDAKLWGIFEGVKLNQRRGHDKVITQSESLEAMEAILDNTSAMSSSALIRRIQNILSHKKQWFI